MKRVFTEQEVKSPDGWVQLTVQDSGNGFESKLKEKIFEPFFTTRRSGTGLGLSITHNIILEHSGKIFVDSKVGQGSIFTIYFPVNSNAARKQVPNN